MFDNLLAILAGVALTLAGGLAYIAAKKGVPAAIAVIKAWWTKGKAELTSLKGDLTAAQAKLATLESDVNALKTKVGI